MGTTSLPIYQIKRAAPHSALRRHSTPTSDAAVAARIAAIRGISKIEPTANWWSADEADLRLWTFADAASAPSCGVACRYVAAHLTKPAIENTDWPQIRYRVIAAESFNADDADNTGLAHSSDHVRCLRNVSPIGRETGVRGMVSEVLLWRSSPSNALGVYSDFESWLVLVQASAAIRKKT